MKRFECRAILFDLDGVLLDSTAYVEEQWRRWARARGLPAEGSWAVATSGIRMAAIERLRNAGLPIPGVLVCAEDVRRGNPSA